MKDVLVPTALFLALLGASPLRAETQICMPEGPRDPVLIINDVETVAPRLHAEYGNGLLVENVPCATKEAGGDFDCESPADATGTMQYFELTRGKVDPNQMSVQIYLVLTRKAPEHGVKHQIVSTGSRPYQCRISDLIK